MPDQAQAALFGEAELQNSVARSIERLRESCLGCTACPLHTTRNQAIFGQGCVDKPPVAFVGDWPGAVEDATGLPFQGPAGQLLDRMIQRMGLTRERVWMCSALACYPGSDRISTTPTQTELASCQTFLHGQLRILRPMVIITLGVVATQTLLRKQKALGDLRGKWFKWSGIPVRPTFHPAYLLRTPKDRVIAAVDLDAVTAYLRQPFDL